MKSYAFCVLFMLVLSGCSNSSSTTTHLSNTSVGTTNSATVTRICGIAAEQMGVDKSKIDASTSLADLGADELDLVELVMTLEEEFNQTISDAEIERLSGGSGFTKGFGKLTMQDLAGLIDN